ncbi:MAG: hypothetical protein AAF587_29345 [Bacteroidota bacterium]
MSKQLTPMSFLTKIQERIEAMKVSLERSSSFDPTRFEDPIASQTAWGPAKGGGANFKTHRMEVVSDTRIKFKASIGMILFSGVFFVTGAAVAIGGGIVGMMDLGDLAGANYFLIVFGAIFMAAGGFMYYSSTPPIVFDKEANVFWKGRKDTRKEVEGSRVKHLVPLEEIHAIQLISEHVSGSESSYYSYELNVVLKDASRINVIDHGKLTSIRNDAEALAHFLNIPLWDALHG